MQINRHGARMYQKLDLQKALKEKRDYEAAQAAGKENEERKEAHAERMRRRPLRKAGKLYKK